MSAVELCIAIVVILALIGAVLADRDAKAKRDGKMR